MYRCEECNRVFGPGVAERQKVVKTRDVVHYETDRNGNRYEAGRGTQIVKALRVCPICNGETNHDLIPFTEDHMIPRDLLIEKMDNTNEKSV